MGSLLCPLVAVFTVSYYLRPQLPGGGGVHADPTLVLFTSASPHSAVLLCLHHPQQPVNLAQVLQMLPY